MLQTQLLGHDPPVNVLFVPTHEITEHWRIKDVLLHHAEALRSVRVERLWPSALADLGFQVEGVPEYLEAIIRANELPVRLADDTDPFLSSTNIHEEATENRGERLRIETIKPGQATHMVYGGRSSEQLHFHRRDRSRHARKHREESASGHLSIIAQEQS